MGEIFFLVFLSSYEIPNVSGLTICKLIVFGLKYSSGASSSGGGVATPSEGELATPANIRAAASSANFRFPHAAGDGSGKFRRIDSSGSGATIRIGLKGNGKAGPKGISDCENPCGVWYAAVVATEIPGIVVECELKLAMSWAATVVLCDLCLVTFFRFTFITSGEKSMSIEDAFPPLSEIAFCNF